MDAIPPTPCLSIFRIDIDGALGCHIHTATHYPPFFCKLWFFEKNNDLLSLRKAFKFQYINVAPNLSARSSLMGRTMILTPKRFWESAVFNSVVVFCMRISNFTIRIVDVSSLCANH